VVGVLHLAPAEFGQRAMEGLLLEAFLRELDDFAVIGRDETRGAETAAASTQVMVLMVAFRWDR